VGAASVWVDQFDQNGNLLVQAIVGASMNAPWGMLVLSGVSAHRGDPAEWATLAMA